MNEAETRAEHIDPALAAVVKRSLPIIHFMWERKLELRLRVFTLPLSGLFQSFQSI